MAKIPKNLVKKLLEKPRFPSSDLVTYKSEPTKRLDILTIAEKPSNGLLCEVAIEFIAEGWDSPFEVEAHLVYNYDFANRIKLELEQLESTDGFMVQSYEDGYMRYKQWTPNPDAKSPLGFDGKACLCDGDGIYSLKAEAPTSGPVNVFLLGKDIE